MIQELEREDVSDTSTAWLLRRRGADAISAATDNQAISPTSENSASAQTCQSVRLHR